MFGKRSGAEAAVEQPLKPVARPAAAAAAAPVAPAPQPARAATPDPVVSARPRKTDEYYELKTQIFGALIDTIDLSQLSKMDQDQAREEIRDIVNDIITVKNVVMSTSEQEDLLEDTGNDVPGNRPPEPLLARADAARSTGQR